MTGIIYKNINNDNVVKDTPNLLSLILDSDSEDVDVISYNRWFKCHTS